MTGASWGLLCCCCLEKDIGRPLPSYGAVVWLYVASSASELLFLKLLPSGVLLLLL
jgi:hypothetical protein